MFSWNYILTIFTGYFKNIILQRDSCDVRIEFIIPNMFKVVDKEYIDEAVVEAHIIPGQLLLTSLIPTKVLVWQDK